MNDADAVLAELLHRLRNRFFGKYRGSVVEVERGGRGRVRAKVPAVLGEATTGWCEPCVPYAGDGVGFAFLPEQGAGVWIEFEGGDLSHPIWSGCYWREGELPPEAAPATKLIVTRAGHRIAFDDEGESVTITDKSGGEIVLDREGVRVTKGGCEVHVSDTKVNINDGAMEVT